ncbi:polymorphic toxin type 44 domain-containing protein [Achromobacter sp. NPDC058515]|uniref:polymorphic toxin type 44 domain-containing protein n=1 Tax=Achromobacter sp. NPDC058515 TaxID=3346533 RepID=UPI0036496F95
MWTERVGPGRPWDHKPALQSMLGQNLNKGWQKYGGFDYYYDIWSNIHYGYVGVALGFSAAELLNGAGLAQAMHDSYKAVMEIRVPTMQDHPANGPWPASADDVPDHISIKLGCDLYTAAKPHELTTAILLQWISAVPVPWGIGEDKAKEPHNCNR